MATRQIALRERLVGLCGGLTLAFAAWGLGGVMTWSLHVMLAGGVLTLALALAPVSSRGETTLSRVQLLAMNLRSLVKVPALWFAAAFIAYLAISALNPAWHIVSDERGWWVEQVTPPLAKWLPTSVEAPYEPMNAWRILIMHLAALSLALGFAIGLKSRRTCLFILWFFVLSSSAMAVTAIAQKYSSSDGVLWIFSSANEEFWGSFFYGNQGAAFLNLAFLFSGILYFYYARKSRDEGRSGGPHFLALMLMGVLLLSVFSSPSRGGMLMLIVLLLAFCCIALVHQALLIREYGSSWWPLLLWLPVLLIGAYLVIPTVPIERIKSDYIGKDANVLSDGSAGQRLVASQATWHMAKDRLWTGWGAGSFRYAFPMYQSQYPEIFYRLHMKHGFFGRKMWNYAHNDILQWLAEYGLIGCCLLGFGFISLLAPALGQFSLSSVYLLLGALCAASHAFFEFIFSSPAYWIAFVGCCTISSRLIHMDVRRTHSSHLPIVAN